MKDNPVTPAKSISPDRINLRIAVACGVKPKQKVAMSLAAAAGVNLNNGSFRIREVYPNYFGDLNACADAVATLDAKQLEDFSTTLVHSRIPCPDGTVEDWSLFEEYGWSGLVKATAPQHCYAFMRIVQCTKCHRSLWDCEQSECKGGV